MGLQVRCKCGAEVVGRRFCAECLPPVATLGRTEWQRRYRKLVAEDAPDTVQGRHQAACQEALQALSPGPELRAVAELAESHAARLDEKPTTGVATEYRQVWALLLGSVDRDEEDTQSLLEEAEFMRRISTPV